MRPPPMNIDLSFCLTPPRLRVGTSSSIDLNHAATERLFRQDDRTWGRARPAAGTLPVSGAKSEDRIDVGHLRLAHPTAPRKGIRSPRATLSADGVALEMTLGRLDAGTEGDGRERVK